MAEDAPVFLVDGQIPKIVVWPLHRRIFAFRHQHDMYVCTYIIFDTPARVG